MISVMLSLSHVVMLSRMAQSSIKTLHKVGFGYSIDNYFLAFPLKCAITMYRLPSLLIRYI